jgi:4-hydroxy-tetrahydrodipicolinate reductase
MSIEKIKIAIYGAGGRMGKMNAITVDKSDKLYISSAVEAEDSPYIGMDVGEVCGIGRKDVDIVSDVNFALERSDVVIDFTTPDATMKALIENKKHNKAFVIGTTGLSETQVDTMKELSNSFPIIYSPNFSIGVNVLFKLIQEASSMLNMELGYDLEIIEAHHRYKKDAPSGTAMKLLEIASKNTGRNIEDAVYGRKGFTGERDINQIGMNVIRAGDIVGEHTVLYSTIGERIEITHKAHSRGCFSNGAIKAAIFVYGKDNGFYSMLDLIYSD